MEVYGATRVGWDENTPVNETVDAEGNLFPGKRGFGVADPNSPKRRVYDDQRSRHSAKSYANTRYSRGWKSANPRNEEDRSNLPSRRFRCRQRSPQRRATRTLESRMCRSPTRYSLHTGTWEQKIYNRDRTVATPL